MKLKAVFLDRDGALIPELPNENNTKAELNEKFIEGLQLLQSYGYLLVIVSNQSGKIDAVSLEKLDEFKKNIIRSCSQMGIYLDGFYYGPTDKENSGNADTESKFNDAGSNILMQAAGDMDIDLSMSWMIGDIISDVEAGERAGCKGVLVAAGKPKPNGRVAARDLADAAKKIVERETA